MFEFISSSRLCSCKFGVIGILVNWVCFMSSGDCLVMSVPDDASRVSQTGVIFSVPPRGPCEYGSGYELTFSRVSQARKRPRLAAGNCAPGVLIIYFASHVGRSVMNGQEIRPLLSCEREAVPEWDGIAVEQGGAVAPYPAGQGARPLACRSMKGYASPRMCVACAKKRDISLCKAVFSNTPVPVFEPRPRIQITPARPVHCPLRYERLCAFKNKNLAFNN